MRYTLLCPPTLSGWELDVTDDALRNPRHIAAGAVIDRRPCSRRQL